MVKKKTKFTEGKPKSTPLPKAIPRPKLKDFLDGAGGAESAGEAEDDAGSDGDEAGSGGSASDNHDE